MKTKKQTDTKAVRQTGRHTDRQTPPPPPPRPHGSQVNGLIKIKHFKGKKKKKKGPQEKKKAFPNRQNGGHGTLQICKSRSQLTLSVIMR